jgi:hypothetical protein
MRHQRFFALAAMSGHPTPWAPESAGIDPARASMRSTGRARDLSNGSEGTVAF